jgi:hypothetical protein
MRDHRADGITSIEAISIFGITRLAAVIYDLKKEGHIIDSTMVEVPTRYGTTTRVARYTLVSP